MKSPNGKHIERLLFNVDWAIKHELGPRDLVPMLEELVGMAPSGSDAALFARRQLAEVLVQTDPWRAALLARDVLSHGADERAFALLGLAYTLLGHFRCAVKAYYRALALCPENPWYAHNLGHLIDAALERPRDALRYLRAAQRALPTDVEVASSYAHALARAGRITQAEGILVRALQNQTRAREILKSWLPGSAPASQQPESKPADSSVQQNPRPAQRRRKKRAFIS